MMQTGEITAVGHDCATFRLNQAPAEVEVYFKDPPPPVPCNPHHHHHHPDELEYTVHKRPHDGGYNLKICWHVHHNEAREIIWKVLF